MRLLSPPITFYTPYAISQQMTNLKTSISLVEGNINLLASKDELKILQNGNKTMYQWLSEVDLSLDGITLAVSNSEYKTIDGVLTALTSARASIQINADNIALKVDKNGVISSINQSSEAVTINASKINLNGVVTANENFKILTDGSMVANNGTFTGNITGSTIQGSEILFKTDDTHYKQLDANGLEFRNGDYSFSIKNQIDASSSYELAILSSGTTLHINSTSINILSNDDTRFSIEISSIYGVTLTSTMGTVVISDSGISINRADSTSSLNISTFPSVTETVNGFFHIRHSENHYWAIFSDITVNTIDYSFSVGDSKLVISTIYGEMYIPHTISDARLKQNIVPAHNSALSRLNQIGIYSFDYKQSSHRDFGVVTQQLKTIFPYAVDEVPQKDNKGTIYDIVEQPSFNELIPVIIKAIQELDSKINCLSSNQGTKTQPINYMLDELRELSNKNICYPPNHK